MSKTKEKPVFSCNCSQVCKQCVSWFARAPLADCYRNNERCDCPCHAKAQEFAQIKAKYRDGGSGYLLTRASDNARFQKASDDAPESLGGDA